MHVVISKRVADQAQGRCACASRAGDAREDRVGSIPTTELGRVLPVVGVDITPEQAAALVEHRA